MGMISQKNVIPGIAMTAAVALYGTAPAGTRWRICNATLCNDTAGVVNCTVHVVKAGDAAGVGNRKISNRPLAVDETYNCPELIGRVLEPGDTVQGLGLGVVLDVSAFTQV